ncbi:MAG: cytochrome C [Acidobacteriaceae bacterium]|nr:cytochrome C [Acidobacteriaceae bacterium]
MHRSLFAIVAVAATTAAAVLAASQPTPVAAQVNPATPEFYTQQVKPILVANCYKCHSGMNHRGGLSVDTKAGLMKGGKDGAVLIPGDVNSMIIKLIRHEGPADDPMPMPPKSKISDADIATVTAWVKAGAMMPSE